VTNFILSFPIWIISAIIFVWLVDHFTNVYQVYKIEQSREPETWREKLKDCQAEDDKLTEKCLELKE